MHPDPRRIAPALLVIIILGLAGYYLIWPALNQDDTLVVSGAIEATEVRLASEYGGRVDTITVAEGVVTDTSQTCFPAQNCILREVEPQTLTIEALFETADFVLGLNDPETEMTFNKTYGYPNAVIYEDASWVVNDFKPLADE